MSELLSKQLCDNLRYTINETDIFIRDEEEKKKFSLICAVMDRFDTAIKYINNHLGKPQTEDEFILFMNYACIIKDGVNYMSKVLNISKKNDLKIFEKVYRNYPIELPKEKYYSDDKFFEYFRSLVFAHPFITNRSIPNAKEGETQYSPFIVLDNTAVLRGINNPIGPMVYTNISDNMFSIIISFDDLKEYIKNKYSIIEQITQKFKNIIVSKQEKWKKHKVNRNQETIGILKECKEILNERCMNFDDIEILIKDLECEVSLEENKMSVLKYREEIFKSIPKICDCLDNYENDAIYDCIRHFFSYKIKAHQMLSYQLEKIFCYLDYEHGYDIKWGLKQAELFSREFAKKWVKIKPYNMNFDEIKMLTRVACFLESQEQLRGDINEQI